MTNPVRILKAPNYQPDGTTHSEDEKQVLSERALMEQELFESHAFSVAPDVK